MSTILFEINKWSFPCVTSYKKNLHANAGVLRDVGSNPGSGRSLGRGHDNPLQYSFWRIPWTEKSGRLQFAGMQRVGRE